MRPLKCKRPAPGGGADPLLSDRRNASAVNEEHDDDHQPDRHAEQPEKNAATHDSAPLKATEEIGKLGLLVAMAATHRGSPVGRSGGDQQRGSKDEGRDDASLSGGFSRIERLLLGSIDRRQDAIHPGLGIGLRQAGILRDEGRKVGLVRIGNGAVDRAIGEDATGFSGGVGPVAGAGAGCPSGSRARRGSGGRNSASVK